MVRDHIDNRCGVVCMTKKSSDEVYERYIAETSHTAMLVKLLTRYIYDDSINSDSSQDLSKRLGAASEDFAKTSSESTIC